MEIEVTDLVEIMRKKLSDAMYESVINEAVSNHLRKRVAELESELAKKQNSNGDSF